MKQLLEDFPDGPLDRYRKVASFDWKKLKLFLTTEELIKYENELISYLRRYNEFEYSNKPLSFEEKRQRAVKRTHILKEIKELQFENQLKNGRLSDDHFLTFMPLDPASYMKWLITNRMCIDALRFLGTKRHNEFSTKALKGEIVFTLCLTEIGHGSNTRGMKTTATYDTTTREFVLHSPDFEAAKCWSGNLGQCATHTIIFAQLVSLGTNHGLHAFVVKIREPHTMMPCEGVVIGDMGEKIELNGLDNGFMLFENYRIPREALLNKIGDVLEDGTYVTPYKDLNKRHGASFGTLSQARVDITYHSVLYLTRAITIALRYSAVRRQFGPGEEEVPILEYQSQQHRLIPYLAATYVFKLASFELVVVQMQYMQNMIAKGNKGKLKEMGAEIHAISCGAKAVVSWVARDGIQECREACAGHGYLKIAGLGEVRDQHDPHMTFEGENHIIIQQTSNWLLKFWPLILNKKRFSTPLNSIKFLNDAQELLNFTSFGAKTISEMCSPETILSAFRWLTCYLLKRTFNKLQCYLQQGEDMFNAKNNSQVFYAKSLTVAFTQHFILQTSYKRIGESKDEDCRRVLLKLLSLYGLSILEKQALLLYEGGYVRGPEFGELLQGAILHLCSDLKDDSVALVDAIAQHDFVVNSALGYSDGMVYKHLEESLMSDEARKRPDWWKEILYINTKAKL